MHEVCLVLSRFRLDSLWPGENFFKRDVHHGTGWEMRTSVEVEMDVTVLAHRHAPRVGRFDLDREALVSREEVEVSDPCSVVPSASPDAPGPGLRVHFPIRAPLLPLSPSLLPDLQASRVSAGVHMTFSSIPASYSVQGCTDIPRHIRAMHPVRPGWALCPENILMIYCSL